MAKIKKFEEKIYAASTILIDEDTKYHIFDEDKKAFYSYDEINNMNLLFLHPNSEGSISFYGKPTIDNAYSEPNIESMIVSYYDFYELDVSEMVDYIITDDVTNKVVFIHQTDINKYKILDFVEVYDAYVSLHDEHEKEMREYYLNGGNDIEDDFIGSDDDIDGIMDEVMKNSVTDEDISVLDDVIKQQIDKKNHTIIEISNDNMNDDFDKLVLNLMNNNMSGTIIFVHNVGGLSSAFDFYIEDNSMVFIDDTISYIFPHMLKKCFQKSTKMLLVVNIDNQIIDGVDLKENYIFNMYKDIRGKYILENVTINKYKNAFMEQFRSEPLICHYVLCDMKGNQYLTFDD